MTAGLDEVLQKFDLINGVGDGKATACAASALGFLWGEAKFSDDLPCAHPIIRRYLIAANDSDGQTPKGRAELVRLGVEGALDTWWVPAEVVVWCLRIEGVELPSLVERTESLLRRIAEWKAEKSRPYLRGADLRGANLSGAYLSGADLRGANLSGANLGGAYLRGANLSGAYLSGADLRGANLSGANLGGAYLRGADLSGANLSGAYLRGADLSGAIGLVLPAGWRLRADGVAEVAS